MLVRSPMVMMSLSPRKTGVEPDARLVVEDHRADHGGVVRDEPLLAAE